MSDTTTHPPRPPYEDMLDALRELASCYVENTDVDDDDTDSYEISRAVRDRLNSLGIITQCEGCSGGYMVTGLGCTREHPCPICGYIDCECDEDEDEDPEGGL